MQGCFLESLTWPEAEQAFARFRVALLPVGARAKEHGLHLPLNTDWLLAEYLTRRVLEQFPALALPTIQYGFYPAFVEYPGSIHIQKDTFRDTVADICRSLARHGLRKVYVLNTGISTNKALEPARLTLQAEGVTLEYTDLLAMLQDVEEGLREQSAGTHADELETSMLLCIRPEVVQMEKARRDIDPNPRPGGLTRSPGTGRGIYSPTGAWGDPTLGTPEKGRILIEALVERLVRFLHEFALPDYPPAPPRSCYLE